LYLSFLFVFLPYESFFFGQAYASFFIATFAIPVFYSATWYLTVTCAGMYLCTIFSFPAMIRVCYNWTSERHVGKVIGILSLSYFFGDGIARVYLSLFLFMGLTWRWIFFAATITLGLISVTTFVLLRDKPEDWGLAKNEADAVQVHHNTNGSSSNSNVNTSNNNNQHIGEEQAKSSDNNDNNNISSTQEQQLQLDDKYEYYASKTSSSSSPVHSLWTRLVNHVKPFMTPSFVVMSIWYTLISYLRYMFLDWFVVYFFERVKFDANKSSIATSMYLKRGLCLFCLTNPFCFLIVIFPVCGGFASIVMGFINDRVSKLTFNIIIFGFEIVLTIVLLVLWIVHVTSSFSSTVGSVFLLILYGLLGFLLSGPQINANIFSIRYGTQSATSMAILDSFAAVASIVSAVVSGAILDLKTRAWTTMLYVGLWISVAVLFSSIVYTIIEARSDYAEADKQKKLQEKHENMHL